MKKIIISYGLNKSSHIFFIINKKIKLIKKYNKNNYINHNKKKIIISKLKINYT